MINFGKTLKIICLMAAASLFMGCAATQVALTKKDLDVQTRTSTAIFVDPVAPAKRTIYLEVRSGVMEFDRNAFKQFLMSQFSQNQNGYRLVDDPEQAHYHMLAYVLNLEKTSPSAAESALSQGYMGGAIATGAVAGYIGSQGGHKSAMGGAVLGGAAEFIAGSLVKDVTFMLVCDVQISEKSRNGAMVRTDTRINSKAGDTGSSRQTVSEVSNRKEYKTRIVTTANKVNLKLETAQDTMFEKTAYAMAGFF